MNIRQKLFASHISVVLIASALLSCMFFAGAKRSIEKEVFDKLDTIVELKAKVIESIFRELKKDIVVAQAFYNIKVNLPILINLKNYKTDPSYFKARETLNDQLKEIVKGKGLANIMFLDTEGNFVAAIDGHSFKDEPEKSISFLGRHLSGANRESVWFSDIYEHSGGYGILVTAPAYGIDDKLIGFIVFGVDMSPIYDIIQDTTGLGRTGETLIGKKIENGAVYLNRLRHDKNAALKRKVFYGIGTGLPILAAVKGESGIGESIDYRGKEVIAAWRYMSSLGWGLVTKIDAKEALKPVRKVRDYTVILTAISLLFAAAYSFVVAKGISEPIRRLHKGSEMIGSGNLDYSVTTNKNDEIGQLSRAFDKMTSDLKKTTASRDELNREVGERRKAEDALNIIQRAVDSSSDAIGISDPSGRHFYQNKAYTEMLGYSVEDLYKPLGVLVTFEDVDAGRDIFNIIMRGGSWRGDMTMMNKSGQEILVNLRANAIKDAGGRIIGLVSIHTDISERKKMQNDLKQRMNDLERFGDLVAGRELRMGELKNIIKDLEKRLGEK